MIKTEDSDAAAVKMTKGLMRALNFMMIKMESLCIYVSFVRLFCFLDFTYL